MKKILGVLVALVMMLSLAQPAHASGERYISLTTGRAMYAEGVNCKVAPGAVTILQAAAYAGPALGKGMGGNAIAMRTKTDNTRTCIGRHIYTNLGDLMFLRNKYGWQHQTSGYDYKVMVTLTPEEQKAEACRALDWTRNNGIYRAWGMMAPAYPPVLPNIDDAAVKVIQSCGFDLVRDYGNMTWAYMPRNPDGSVGFANLRYNHSPEGYWRTLSLNGGDCPSTWNCQDGSRHYTYPQSVIYSLRNAPPDSHSIIQNYRFVTGNVPGKWQCDTMPHMTYNVEAYCYNDWRKIVDWIKQSNYIPADPATVVQKWGLTP